MGYFNDEEYQDGSLKAHDITWLFRMAQDWLMSNPGEQIPKDVWAQKLSEVPAPDEIPLAIFVAGIGIHHISPEIIPALAAISLRRQPEIVAGILDHHGADYYQMIYIQYNYDDLTAEQRKSSLAVDTKNLVLDSFTVAKGVIDALSSSGHQRAVMLMQAKQYPCTPATTLAKLISNVPDLWPITHINDAFERLDFATFGDIHASAQKDYSNLWDGLRYVQLPDVFTGDDYIRLLDRSGALHLGACLEHGFPDDLFRRIPVDTPSDTGAYNAQRFLDAINTEQRPEVIERISKKMMSALKAYNMDGFKWTDRLNKGLEERIGQTYSAVLNNLSVRLNLRDISVFTADDLLKLNSTEELLPYTQSKVNRLLMDAAADFLVISPDDLEINDFGTIHRVLRTGLDQEYDNQVINQLMASMLNGAENLAKRYRHQPANGKNTLGRTHDLVDECVQHLASKIEPDYELFNSLSSRSQGVLAAGGLDIKKFPRMSRVDRARVLESDLGM